MTTLVENSVTVDYVRGMYERLVHGPVNYIFRDNDVKDVLGVIADHYDHSLEGVRHCISTLGPDIAQIVTRRESNNIQRDADNIQGLFERFPNAKREKIIDAYFVVSSWTNESRLKSRPKHWSELLVGGLI